MPDDHTPQFARDLATAPAVLLRLDPITAWTLLGALQLATRHPDMGDTVRGAVYQVAHTIEGAVAVTPLLATIAAAGWGDDHQPVDDPDAEILQLYQHIAALDTRASTDQLREEFRSLPTTIAGLAPPGIPPNHPIVEEIVTEIRARITDELARRGEPIDR